MKGKDSKRRTQNTNKKGFYVALYSCIGVLLVVAVAIGYTNLNKEPIMPNQESLSFENSLDVDTAQVNRGNEESSDFGQIGLAMTSEDDDAISKKPTATEQTNPSDDTENKDSVKKPEEEEKLDEEKKETDSVQTEDSQDTAIKNDGNEEDAIKLVGEESKDFMVYDSKEKMSWPVLGEIVMDFSVDSLVYDKTLEQYRTNDNICISAPSGAQVGVAAEGIVVEITNTKELGNTVVVDHGNGWVTTYSQLQDNILVNVGDVVEEKQIIGGVGDPSIYSILLGNHLSFEILKDETPVNPKDILASN